MRILFTILTILASLILMYNGEQIYFSERLELIHICIVVICCYMLFSQNKRPYSLYKTFHIFFLFFLGIAPWIQFKLGIHFWGGGVFYEKDYWFTSLWCLLILILYNMLYTLFAFKIKGNIFDNLFQKRQMITIISWRKKLLAICITVGIIFIIIAYKKFNLLSLFVRGMAEGVVTTDNQILWLLIDNFLRPINIMLFLFSYLFYRKYKFFTIFLFLMGVLAMAPTAVPRYAAAAIYIPVFMFLFPALRRKNVYVLLFIFGLLFVWPFFNAFRVYSSDMIISWGGNDDLFRTADMDSYSSWVRVMKYDIVTSGKQLLGSLLFFVPRSIWIEKPVGSGAFLYDKIRLDFSNIACNYFAEGYINGGYVGMILFTLVLAWITASMDNHYWNNDHTNQKSVFEIFYFICLGFLFFILRGDLMSSLAYIVGFICSLYVAYYFFSYSQKTRTLLL